MNSPSQLSPPAIRFGTALGWLLSATFATAQPLVTKVVNYNASVSLGAAVKMQVWATGSTPLGYQWWFGGQALTGKTSAILSLTNVQTSDAGLYTVVVTDSVGSASTNVSLEVEPTFTKVLTGSLVTDLAHQHGQAWGDYDHDGFLDVLVFDVDRKVFPLYRNNHDGTFTRLLLPGLQGSPSLYSYTLSWVDYDNDGHLDVFAADASGSGGRNNLIHNNGDGTFTRLTNGPIVTEGGVSWQGYWGDYNRDGWLDLFVGNGAVAGVPSRNWCYQNRGDGSFLKLTNVLTSDLGLFGFATWLDVDGDSWQDLFAVVYQSANRLYLNTREGGFRRVTGDPLVSEPGNWFAPAWADYDNNGTLDLFLTTFGVQYVGPVALYRNDGGGQFTKMTTNDAGPLVTERGNVGSAAWGDYDNDGWLDLFVASGRDETERGKCWLYRNQGNGTFGKITSGSPVNELAGATAANWVDIDRDGFLDLLIAENDHTGLTPNHLYRNNGNSNHWLCVQCEGTASARRADGAKVFLTATIRGTRMRQHRLIDLGGSTGNQTPVAHFGLGDATNAEILRIEWTSGTVQEFRNVPAGQYLTLTEPARLTMPTAGELHIQCWKGMVYQIESSGDLASWTPLATVTNLNLTGGIRWTDPDAPGIFARFYRAVKQ